MNQLRDENAEIQKKKASLLDALTQLQAENEPELGGGVLTEPAEPAAAGGGSTGGDADAFYKMYGEQIEAKLREAKARRAQLVGAEVAITSRQVGAVASSPLRCP